MADIAMLVAEDYERRIKNSRKFGANNVDGEQIELFSTLSILAQEIKGSSSRIKMRFGENEKRVFVPQTEVSLAAINECVDCHTRTPSTGTTYICIDSNICSDCSNSTCECCSENQSCTDCECGNCLGGDGDQSGIPGLLVLAVIVLGLFALLGMFYSVLVATMVGQRIWQRHYHILEKTMLTKEYVVEDVGEVARNDWSPPPLPQQHVQKLESLGLL